MKRITKKEILRLKKEYAEDWDYYVECKLTFISNYL